MNLSNWFRLRYTALLHSTAPAIVHCINVFVYWCTRKMYYLKFAEQLESRLVSRLYSTESFLSSIYYFLWFWKVMLHSIPYNFIWIQRNNDEAFVFLSVIQTTLTAPNRMVASRDCNQSRKTQFIFSATLTSKSLRRAERSGCKDLRHYVPFASTLPTAFEHVLD